MSLETRNCETVRRSTESGGTTNLRVLVLRKLLKLAFELSSNLVSLLRASVLDYCLNYTTGIVFEDDILDFAADDLHEILDMLLAFGRREVFPAQLRPHPFRLDEQI